MEKKSFIRNLKTNGKKVFSQTQEDGILSYIFENIGTINKYFVEFGAWDGKHLSNTANLRINNGWDGLLLEGEESRCNDLVKHAFVTPENVNNVFTKYNVPTKFDLLSIDIDSVDYWVWKALDSNKFNPNVVIIEYNSSLDPLVPVVAEKYTGDLTCFGASIAALYNLGKEKGYSLVFRVGNQNLIFVKNELLHIDDQNIPIEKFVNKNNETINGASDGTPHWNEFATTRLTRYFGVNKNGWVNV